MSNPKQQLPAKANLSLTSPLAKIQVAIRDLMILAKAATFNIHSTYALSIKDGLCIVDFA